MFDRKKYMKEYYLKNKDKLKTYSNDYKKKDKEVSNVSVKTGVFLVSFN